MSQWIESMESRTLFTASPAVIAQDVVALNTAAKTSTADLTASLALANADVKAIKAAVVAVHPTTAQKKTVSTLTKDEVIAAAKYKAKILGILSTGRSDGVRLVAGLKVLEAKPTNAAAQARVQAALAKLQAVLSPTVVSTVESNAATTVATLNTDSTAVATAVPSAQTPVSAFQSHLSADLLTLSAQASALQGAIAALASALA